MTLIKSILYVFFALFLNSALAAKVADNISANSIAKRYPKIISVFHKKFPTEKISTIEKSPINGIFEVIIPPHVYYTNKDAAYVFNGDIFNLSDEKNITQGRRKLARKISIDMLDPENMIIFPAKKSKYTISVFTDVDCVFCRKLHSKISEYNKFGITVRYLSFPRGGVKADSFSKAVSVWCSKDKRKALTDAKNDIEIDTLTCDSPVLKHYNLGKKFGIQGTPAIVLADGDVISGYVEPNKLISELKARERVKVEKHTKEKKHI